MKKAVVFILFLMSFLTFNAQTVSYQTEADDPQKYFPRLNINLMLMGMDGGYQNIDGLYFYAGTHGQFMLNNRMGIQWNMNRAWMTLGRLGFADYKPATDLNIGAVLYLTNASRVRNISVVLKQEAGKKEGTTVTTSIRVPATRQIQWGVHGGLYRKSVAYGFGDKMYEAIDDLGVKHATFSSTGLYGGFIKRRLTNLHVNVEGYGKRFNSLGFETYFDAILTFANNFTLLDPDISGTKYKKGDNITADVKALAGSSPIGFRIGWNGYQIAPKSVTNKKFGMSYNFEVGVLPYQGIFIRGGIGLTLVKKAGS